MDKTTINPQSFSLKNAEHQNYLLDLFFDNFYTIVWDSLDQLEYAINEVIRRNNSQKVDNEVEADNKNQNPWSIANNSSNSFDSKLTPLETKLIKDGIDSFMEEKVEPDLKKCMDIFEMILAQQVLPKISNEPDKTKEFDNMIEESNKLLNPVTEIEYNSFQESQAEILDINVILHAKEGIKNAVQILDYLKHQEALMIKYKNQINKINLDLHNGSKSLLESIELMKMKRRELTQVYNELNECFDKNPTDDIMELLDGDENTPRKYHTSQEY